MRHDPDCEPNLTPAQLQRVLCFAEYVRETIARWAVPSTTLSVSECIVRDFLLGCGLPDPLEAKFNKVRAERDELLAALRSVLSNFEKYLPDGCGSESLPWPQAVASARALIARIEGGR